MAARFTKPYVDALLSVVDARTAEGMLPPLARFGATLDASAELQGFFRNPAVPRDRKEAALAALAARAGVDETSRRLMRVLLLNGRLLRLGEVVRAVRERVDRERKVVEASLVTAAPLADAEAERIRTALEGRTGRSVRLARAVDPALLGGFVVRVGSEVYDASLAQRLRKTRQALHQGSGSAEGHHG